MDARQEISGMTKGRGCPTGMSPRLSVGEDFGHDKKKVIPDFFCRESKKIDERRITSPYPLQRGTPPPAPPASGGTW